MFFSNRIHVIEIAI